MKARTITMVPLQDADSVMCVVIFQYSITADDGRRTEMCSVLIWF
jgi:hypothetical protein